MIRILPPSETGSLKLHFYKPSEPHVDCKDSCLLCDAGFASKERVQVACRCPSCKEEFQLHTNPSQYDDIKKFLKDVVEKRTDEYELLTGETISQEERDDVHRSYIEPYLTFFCQACSKKEGKPYMQVIK